MIEEGSSITVLDVVSAYVKQNANAEIAKENNEMETESITQAQM